MGTIIRHRDASYIYPPFRTSKRAPAAHFRLRFLGLLSSSAAPIGYGILRQD